MRILLTSNASYDPPRGGSTRSNLAWLRQLAAAGHECHVICASMGGDAVTERDGIRIESYRDLARRTEVLRAAIARVPPLSLPGAHQRRNAAAAIAAVEALGVSIDLSALARVVHPGRFERVGDIILDGAHNPHGAAALAAALDAPVVLIIGTSADKDAAGIAAALAPVARHVIATRYQQDRAMDPAQLAACFPRGETAPDLGTALARARALGGPIVIAGSLFLVGEARVLLLGAPADPVWVSDPPASSR